MKKLALSKICLLSFLIFLAPLGIADDIVIEVLISTKDNQSWNPKKSMHLTIAHLKNIEGATIENAIHDFNSKKEKLLTETLSPGFIVNEFNTDGFGKGFHILLETLDDAKRLVKLNDALYQYLSKHYLVQFTDITSPRYIYATGFIPHIEFIEQNKIPQKGVTLHFSNLKLSSRIVNFDRK